MMYMIRNWLNNLGWWMTGPKWEAVKDEWTIEVNDNHTHIFDGEPLLIDDEYVTVTAVEGGRLKRIKVDGVEREVVVDYDQHQDDVVAYGTYAMVDDAETT